jgi:hypothetical protein
MFIAIIFGLPMLECAPALTVPFRCMQEDQKTIVLERHHLASPPKTHRYWEGWRAL